MWDETEAARADIECCALVSIRDYLPVYIRLKYNNLTIFLFFYFPLRL